MAFVLITHSWRVAETADRLGQCGQKLKSCGHRSLQHPHHPYTAALLAALPKGPRRTSCSFRGVPRAGSIAAGLPLLARCRLPPFCRPIGALSAAYLGYALCITPALRPASEPSGNSQSCIRRSEPFSRKNRKRYYGESRGRFRGERLFKQSRRDFELQPARPGGGCESGCGKSRLAA